MKFHVLATLLKIQTHFIQLTLDKSYHANIPCLNTKSKGFFTKLMPVLCNLSTCSNQDHPYLNCCLSKICFIGDCLLESYKKSKLQKHIA